MIKFGSIKQIIIYVKDMEKEVAFYEKILGLEISYPANLSTFADEFWVTFSTGECTLCLHAGGKIEKGETNPVFTFEVKNVNKAKDYLIKNGVKTTDIRIPVPENKVFDGFDPEGNKFSVEEFGKLR